MMDPREKTLAIGAAGQIASALLDLVEPMAASASEAVDRRVFALVMGGTLTPDEAMRAWYEKAAWHRVLAAIRKPIAAAEAAKETDRGP